MTYPCPTVSTMVPLDTQQIKFLLDSMWSLSKKDAAAISASHGVSDHLLEFHLQNCLLDALKELD